MDISSVTLHSADVVVDVSPHRGGRLAQINVRDTPLLVGESQAHDPIVGWGCFPMVPWAGRMRNATFPLRGRYVKLDSTLLNMEGPHALHGTCTNRPWRVVAHSASSMVMRIDLEETGWPFGGWVEQRISLSPASVQMEMSVHSEKNEFPVQIGWHPWFAAPEVLDVAFASMHVRDADGITTAETVPPAPPTWDDCFVGPVHPPRLRVNGVNIELSSDCSHWVVFNELAHGVCVEPQSGPPDMLNLLPPGQLDMVGPGRTVVRHFTMSFV